MHTQHIDVSQLGSVVKAYEATGEELDNRLLDLEREMADIEKEVEAERTNLIGTAYNERLNIRAVIGVFAEVEGEVEIALIYGRRFFKPLFNAN